MKKLAVITGFMMLLAAPAFAGASSMTAPALMDATASFSGHATLENGMTLLLMMSAFYMIGKNFMLEGRMAEIREKVKFFFRF